MLRGRSKVRSQRQLRVGEELRHILAHILERGELNDPAVRDTTITITEVGISADLKNATAYVIPLGGDKIIMRQVLIGLNRATPYLRRAVAEKIHLNYIPRLSFVADTTFDDAGHIEGLLRDPSVARDLEFKDDGT